MQDIERSQSFQLYADELPILWGRGRPSMLKRSSI